MCTEVCYKLFAEVPSKKRARESSGTNDHNDLDSSDERVNFTDPEQLSRMQLSDYGHEV